MRDAIRAAFGEHDDNLRHSLGTEGGRVLWQTFFDLVIRPLIDGQPARTGGSVLFSLNQDLMLERAMPRVTSLTPPTMPGLNLPSDPRFPNQPDRVYLGGLKPTDLVTIPDVLPPIAMHALNIVKLHGSISWRAQKPDGSTDEVLVLGGGDSGDQRSISSRIPDHVPRRLDGRRSTTPRARNGSRRRAHQQSDSHCRGKTKQLRLFVDQRPETLRATLEKAGIWSYLIGCMHRRVDESFTTGSTIGRSGEARRIVDHFFRS